MDISTYFEEIEVAAARCITIRKAARAFLEELLETNFSLASQLINCRKEVLVRSEIDQARALFALEIFPSLPDDERVSYITICIDLEGSINRRSIIHRCEKYSLQQQLFQQVPELFNHIRRRGSGQLDYELIDVRILEGTTNPRTFRYKGKYVVVDHHIKSGFVDLLKQDFADAPLFLRIYPHVVHDDLPPLGLEEAITIPTDPHWWKNLSLYNKMKTGGSYILEDCAPSQERLNQFRDYRIKKIRRLETIVSRDNNGHLSMMLEELSERDRDYGFIIGRCVHLDTFDPVGTPFEQATLSHLDLAINVYCGETIDKRLYQFAMEIGH